MIFIVLKLKDFDDMGAENSTRERISDIGYKKENEAGSLDK